MNLSRLLFRLALGRRLPTVAGTLVLAGLRRPVTIRRDGWGVPTVDADNDYDAWFGLGFCHGQDRAFHLETLIRVVRGTLSELVGPKALPVDRLARRVGFVRAAGEQLAVIDADIREMLEAYAAGVNAGHSLGVPRRAHEFAILRSQPTAWSAVDALGLLKLQSFALVSNWDVELARFRIFEADGPEALQALDPAYPAWLPVTSPPGKAAGLAADRLAEDLSVFASVVKLGGGSNNWALAASRTRTGRPILANDPHLPGTLPPHWYLAQLRTPQWRVAGASYLGGPIFPAGHNGHVAWGVTVGLVDNTDLFLEEVGPDGRSIRQGDGFVACEVRSETIRVKGAAPVVETVLVTPRGPIVSPPLQDTPEAFSLRATWLEARPVRGLLGLHQARDFASFRRCLSQWPALSFNVAYADAAGTIGWQMAGLAPRRRQGFGTFPLPGWMPDAGWHDEPVPYEEMPYVVNPPGGYVATANNKPVADATGPFLSSDFADGYRVAAVLGRLAERTDWDVASTLALQRDLTCLPWKEMRDVVLAVPAGPDAATAAELLRAWDGKLNAESPGAAVYELFIAEMCRRVAQAKAPKSYEYALGRGWSPIAPLGFFAERRVSHLVDLLTRQPEGWFTRPWPEEMADALAVVSRRLHAEQGSPLQWAWGRLRPLILRHPLGAKPALRSIFNLGPIPLGGDANTIAQAAVPPLDPTGQPAFIPSLRMVVDLGDWSASRFILPGGQSGNPLSPHYADQLPLWQRGEGIPISWTEAEIQASTRATLRLVPVQ